MSTPQGVVSHSIFGRLLGGSSLIIIALILCALPLFNMPGYESALVLAVVSSFVGVWQGVASVHHDRKKASALHRESLALHRGSLSIIFSCIGQAWVLVLVGLLLAECILFLNGLRISNCSITSGLGFFIMMPVLSSVISCILGVFVGLMTSTLLRGLVIGYAGLFLLSIHSLLRVVTSPAIYLYDPFFGYFPGSIYDEAIEINAAFFWARVLHLSWAWLLILGSALFLDKHHFKITWSRGNNTSPGKKFVSSWGAGLLVSALIPTLLFCMGGRLGIYTDVSSVESYLEKAKESDHFILRYRPEGFTPKEIETFVEDLEFRYTQLRRQTQSEPLWRTPWILRLLGVSAHEHAGGPPKIVVYVFSKKADKERLIGAADTYIAKPWRREVYIHKQPWPHPVLKHELAHIFAGTFGGGILRVSSRYGIPQPGMIEGVAAALQSPSGQLSIHQQVKLMRRLGIQPDLKNIFGLSFWTLPSTQAYVAAGSFCLYLLERFGPERLFRIYTHGGTLALFAEVYRQPFEALKKDWEQFVDSQPLEDLAVEKEEEQLRQPSLFQKKCAHEVALQQKQIFTLWEQGDEAGALLVLEGLCRSMPMDVQYRVEKMELAWALGRYPEAEKEARAILAVLGSRSQRMQAYQRLGDLAAFQGNFIEAKVHYEQALLLIAAENQARLIQTKLILLQNGEIGPALLDVLLGAHYDKNGLPIERTEAKEIFLLAQACSKSPGFGLCHYLLGLRLFQGRAYEQAASELETALSLGLPDKQFAWQAMLTLGQAQLLQGKKQSAKDTFVKTALKVGAHDPGKGNIVDEWIERAAFSVSVTK